MFIRRLIRELIGGGEGGADIRMALCQRFCVILPCCHEVRWVATPESFVEKPYHDYGSVLVTAEGRTS